MTTYKKVLFMTICFGFFLGGGLISSLLDLKLPMIAQTESAEPKSNIGSQTSIQASIVSNLDAVPVVSSILGSFNTAVEIPTAVVVDRQAISAQGENQQTKLEVALPPDAQNVATDVSAVISPEVNAQSLALLDKYNRFSTDFSIPKGLENRVAFWLDVYTKYDSKNYLVHHKDFPWIVFDVVDTTPLFLIKRNAKWLNRTDADKTSEKHRASVVSNLKKLLKFRTYENLTGEEARLFDLLKTLPGSRKKVINQAINSIRIQLGQKDMFEQGLMRSSPFLPVMEQVFIAHGLPKELVRIPLVESSFNLEAHSRVGALGVWQIMPGVGKTGMIITSAIDERQSPLKSTVFAAKMLKQNRRSLKEWPLAVTAYNHGTGSLLKAVRSLKTYDLQSIIDRNPSKSFQFASANFYACFLAALRGEKYSAELFPSMKRPQALDIVKFTLKNGLSVGSLAKKIGLQVADLQLINPDLPENLKSTFNLPAGFQIYLPHDKAKDLKAVQGLTQQFYLAADRQQSDLSL